MNINLDETFAECPEGLECQKCHNLMELLFNPFHYKIHQCQSTTDRDDYQCEEKKKICAFNHSNQDQQCAKRAIVSGVPTRLPPGDGMEAYEESEEKEEVNYNPKVGTDILNEDSR